MNRLDLLKDLVSFSKPLTVLSDGLSKFDWDYQDSPLIVPAVQIQEVLKRFIIDEFSAQELEDWANLIECREDLEFEEKKHDEIVNAIHRLANPALHGEITPDVCEALIASLEAH